MLDIRSYMTVVQQNHPGNKSWSAWCAIVFFVSAFEPVQFPAFLTNWVLLTRRVYFLEPLCYHGRAKAKVWVGRCPQCRCDRGGAVMGPWWGRGGPDVWSAGRSHPGATNHFLGGDQVWLDG